MNRIGRNVVGIMSLVLWSLPSLLWSADTLVVFGASGHIGGEIVKEALDRGYRIVGVSRNPGKMTFNQPGFVAREGDVTDVESFRNLVQGAKAVVISVQGNAHGNEPEQSTHALAAKVAIEVLSGMQNPPYVIQIGGSTTLYNSAELMAKNLPFPADPGSEMWGMFFGHWVALEAYRASGVPWTVLTPPWQITGAMANDPNPGSRTGKYRTAAEERIMDANGNNSISLQDLAVATIDEIENRQNVGRRFTVGY